MPAAIAHADLAPIVQRIVLTSSETDYVDQLIPIIKDARTPDRAGRLLHHFDALAADRETEIERMCSTNHQDFVKSVNDLLRIREGTAELTSEILGLTETIQSSTEQLAAQKKALVESRSVRENIDDATKALNACLDVLQLANQVHDLLAKKKHYAALRALEELQNVHLREISRYKIAEIIEKSVPATQKLIAEAVMTDLNTWLFRIREASQYLGEVAFYHTEMRKERMKERTEQDDYMAKYGLNSAVELVADEMDEFDILNNEETDVQIDFSPLYEAVHIHETLGRYDQFRAEYAATRRRQKDLLVPTALNLRDEDVADLSSILEGIAGFAILERATMMKTDNLRAGVDVDELWDSMCRAAITLISNNLHDVDKDETLLKIKGRVALFIQTVDTWGYATSSLHSLVLTIFDNYSKLLKRKFSEDFEEIVTTDDYMPMPINTLEEYDKVVEVSWYNPDTDRSDLQFPCVLPFSQMYPLCCIDIRNFLNQIYLFSDDEFERANVIDETLKRSLDELLCDKVCQTLVDRLSSQYPGQVVQILTNFEHFETACEELQNLLFDARSSQSASGPVILQATERFREGRKTAEKRIFELVNSKIDDLIETAEYDWMTRTPPGRKKVSNYMQELTRYLDDSMHSALLGLPTEIKELIYFDALSHAATSILSLPLDSSVRGISPAAIQTLANDVQHLVDFVDGLGNPILKENLDELVQTVALMQSDTPDEFYDVSQRNKKYGRVDREHGAILLEKVMQGQVAPLQPSQSYKQDAFAMMSSRFGLNK
ncbi:exocyst complex subunit Sec15-like protein [Eremomyces bilateralis CBS 781.70]|uniref:Exocyst complex component SEC15 n=1 Tax=Eremomyces bilateralis CBS 781.70 TaxID=1392243 RepID=A0A6G1G255_9PEZI|nr:exocyst complex subunit Sec15-like protein [Eremomyces bilateralis CBS 781.70]KAF1812006.1 exocyst complex subunit Sec15-like protein [Eremomyces bilateralis CBS 781.70]